MNAPPNFGGPAPEPPASFDHEQALLGALLVDPTAMDQVADLLLAEHFGEPAHQAIYATLAAEHAAGRPADGRAVQWRLANEPALADVGGAAYVGELVANALGFINAQHYATFVRDLYLRRALIGIGSTAVQAAHRPDNPQTALEQCEALEAQLYQLAAHGRVGDFTSFDAAVQQSLIQAEGAYQGLPDARGLQTGYRAIDHVIGGLRSGSLVVLGGRPAMGKTALAMGVATSVAARGKAVAVFSMEMGADQLAGRLIAQAAEVEGSRIAQGHLSTNEWQRVADAGERIKSLPLHIDDSGARTPVKVRTACRRLARRLTRQGSGLALVVIDYLQLMHVEGGRGENRVQEISQISRALQELSVELGVPVLALSQLNRGVEGREDKRPGLADLRESGSIEQDAAVVMFLYREEYYLLQRRPDAGSNTYETWERAFERSKGRADVIVAKNRFGRAGLAELAFDAWCTRFRDIDAGGSHDAHLY